MHFMTGISPHDRLDVVYPSQPLIFHGNSDNAEWWHDYGSEDSGAAGDWPSGHCPFAYSAAICARHCSLALLSPPQAAGAPYALPSCDGPL